MTDDLDNMKASLRQYARINHEWGRVVEGQPAMMEKAADAIETFEARIAKLERLRAFVERLAAIDAGRLLGFQLAASSLVKEIDDDR